MRLFKRACAVGMAPNDFWDSEPADASQYIEARGEEDRHRVYSECLLSAQLFGITLCNAFRGHNQQVVEYPTYEEVYAIPKEEKPREEQEQERLQRRIADLRLQFAHKLN